MVKGKQEPELRFPEYKGTGSWEEIGLKKVLKERKTYSEKDGEYPHVTLSKEGIYAKSDRYDRDFLVTTDDKKYKITKLGDICYNPANLKFGVICENIFGDAIFSPIYVTFVVSETIDKGFMSYFITREKFIQEVRKYEEGTVYERKAVKPDDFLKYTAILPKTKEEQQKIGQFFQSLDNRITLQEKLITNLQEYKKGLLHQIMSRTVRFRKADGGEYPEWEEKCLEEICEDFKYGLNSAAIDYDGKHKYIRITDILENGRYNNSNPVSPSGEFTDEFIVRENDILFARTGATVGKTYVYNKNDGLLYFAGFLIRARVKKANAYFVYQQLQTDDYWKWVKVVSMRTGQPGINSVEYGSFKIQLPCTEEQEQIASLFSSLDHKIELEEQKLSLLKEQKAGFMQKMFI